MIWQDQSFTYNWMLDRFDFWCDHLCSHQIGQGNVVVLKSDYSPDSIAMLLSLIALDAIIAPITNAAVSRQEELEQIAQGEISIAMSSGVECEILKTGRRASHPLFDQLRYRSAPGLVLFSSGSTGKSKAAVHDFNRLLKKYQVRRKDFRTLAFLLFDHIGGVDTLFYALSNGSCIVTVQDRSVETICRAVEHHRVEVLPVTPTFLNLLAMSSAYESYDLSSLQIITYGTEVMPSATLERTRRIFPWVSFIQKYGATEVGTLRSRSQSSDSVWVKIGGEGYQIRVVNNMLEIKAESAMLGYINAPSPFTEDGWFMTGDAVEVDGEFMRILGRQSELINVGGMKVYPAEVENVILELAGVAEVRVYAEPNPILGQIVCADIRTTLHQEPASLIRTVRRHCAARLDSYKVPIKIIPVDEAMYTDRFKLIRNADQQ